MEGTKILKENRLKSGLRFGLVSKKPIAHRAEISIYASADGKIKYVKVPRDRDNLFVPGVCNCACRAQRLSMLLRAKSGISSPQIKYARKS